MDVRAIEFKGLVKDYGTVRALDGIDLSVPRGEIFGFLGPNGAGKTTAIRVLLDLIRPTAGSASLLGFDSRAQSAEVRRRCGYLPGDLRIYEDLSGRQTIDFFASLRPGSVDASYLGALIERLGFDPAKLVSTLSRGNRQKLGLIVAMMHRPEVLVMDEPTSGLDPLVQGTVEELLREHVADGGTVFFSSHILSEVEDLCTRVGIIRAGRIVAVEEVGSLKGRSLHVLEVTFARPPQRGDFAIPGVTVEQADGARLRIEVKSNLDAVLKAIARHEVVDLRTEQPSLEQVFLAYYQDAARVPEEEEEARRAAS